MIQSSSAVQKIVKINDPITIYCDINRISVYVRVCELNENHKIMPVCQKRLLQVFFSDFVSNSSTRTIFKILVALKKLGHYRSIRWLTRVVFPLLTGQWMKVIRVGSTASIFMISFISLSLS
jgi:hypothetical protein